MFTPRKSTFSLFSTNETSTSKSSLSQSPPNPTQWKPCELNSRKTSLSFSSTWHSIVLTTIISKKSHERVKLLRSTWRSILQSIRMHVPCLCCIRTCIQVRWKLLGFIICFIHSLQWNRWLLKLKISFLWIGLWALWSSLQSTLWILMSGLSRDMKVRSMRLFRLGTWRRTLWVRLLMWTFRGSCNEKEWSVGIAIRLVRILEEMNRGISGSICLILIRFQWWFVSLDFIDHIVWRLT